MFRRVAVVHRGQLALRPSPLSLNLSIQQKLLTERRKRQLERFQAHTIAPPSPSAETATSSTAVSGAHQVFPSITGARAQDSEGKEEVDDCGDGSYVELFDIKAAELKRNRILSQIAAQRAKRQLECEAFMAWQEGQREKGAAHRLRRKIRKAEGHKRLHCTSQERRLLRVNVVGHKERTTQRRQLATPPTQATDHTIMLNYFTRPIGR